MRFVSVVALLITACDLPTELPRWNATFAVPLEGISIPLTQMLPGGVDVSPDGTAFVISGGSYAAEYYLTNICAPCRPLEGQLVPKPAFQGGIGYPIPLPAGLDSASVVSGSIAFSVANGWAFDPLRPAAGQTGAITVDVGSRDLESRGFTAFVGSTHSFPPGSTMPGALTFGGTPVQMPFVHVRFNSPAGDPVRIDGQSKLTFVLTSARLVATDVSVTIGQRQITGRSVQLDLTGIDDFIIRRTRGGRLVLAIDNEFAVRGTMTVAIGGGSTSVTKTFTMAADDATSEVPLTEAELEAMLGRSVTLTLTGLVGTAGPAVLTPASTFTVAPLLVLELGPDS